MAESPRSSPVLPVYWDEQMQAYRPPDGAYYLASDDDVAADEPHPECPERVQNIKHIIETHLSEVLEWRGIEPATDRQLTRVHESAYVRDLEGTYGEAPGWVTTSTWADAATLDAARLAANAAIQAAEATIASPDEIPYALVRPSGHHAQPACADGYCFYNNVSLAAEHALDHPDVDSVFVLDWDVHHGNGTQEVFYDREDVLFVSLHNDYGAWDSETHPQTGLPDEHGTGAGEGYNVNVPLPGGTGDEGYRRVFDRLVEPIAREYDPDLVLVSVGQDPGIVDPQGRNAVSKAGFEAMGRRIRDLAADIADDRLAIVQEGGYQQSHLAYATLGVLEGVLGFETGVTDPYAGWNESLAYTDQALDDVEAHLSEFWRVLDAN